MTRFLLRLRGVLTLRPYTYEDIEADETAFPQALLVVILSSLATGVAYLPSGEVAVMVTGVVVALIGWLIWSWLTYFIGTHWLAGPDTEADWGQLLRTTGFATAPGMLRVFGLLAEARTPSSCSPRSGCWRALCSRFGKRLTIGKPGGLSRSALWAG
jgi:hypothetical protein